ncbi:hypothetical protein ASF88_16120 [Leifsonia sp. Leaf336]|nr:hypothetical protein ASF88_16120 [Leifsonia sp. Leaf336]
MLIIAAPVGLGLFGFAIFNVQGFMNSTWAFWALMACIFVPYSILYTADMLRRREARRGGGSAGDASPLVFAGGLSPDESEGASSATHSGVRSSTAWIWGGLVLVIAYAGFRIAWALVNGAQFDWTAVVALVVAAGLAIIHPSALGWQRFRRSVRSIGSQAVAWPTFRTDQFAGELHVSRPGATIPQDLILLASESTVSVWTTEREPKLLLSLPRDVNTKIRAMSVSDRLGSTGVRMERQDGPDSHAFDLIVRRRGIFTYFRTDQATAQLCAAEIASSRPATHES